VDEYYSDEQSYKKLKVRTNVPGIFVMSENFHPYWKAKIDGRSEKIFRVNYLWQGVVITPGDHLVEFEFFEPIIYYSHVVSMSALYLYLVLMAWTLGIRFWKSRR